jgi:hypothetical protein
MGTACSFFPSIKFNQNSRGDPKVVEHGQGRIADHGPADALVYPSSGGGRHFLGQNLEWCPGFFYFLHQGNIFHQGNFVKPVDTVEQLFFKENGLVSIGNFRDP